MKKENKKKYYSVSECADILHRASSLYYASNMPIDYGTGTKYTSVEVHMLKYIVNNPGLTVKMLAKAWDKSKAAISQMMKQLIGMGLIEGRSSDVNSNIKCYYPTKKGIELDRVHENYDTRVFAWSYDRMVEEMGKDDVDKCFEVLEGYTKIRMNKHYHSPKDE